MSDSGELDATYWAAVGRVEDWLDHPPEAAARAAWLRAAFRFTRADGSAIFGPRGRSPERLRTLERLARGSDDLPLGRVLNWWRPARRGGEEDVADEAWAPPPLPSAGWLDGPLAVLRPNWMARGDCVAVDHRAPGLGSLVEVAGRGATWIGPTWDSPALAGEVSPARTSYWSSGAYADAFEWSFAVGTVGVTRSAVLIRGGHLALLMQTELGVGPGVGAVRWGLPAGVEARADPALRALVLSAGPGRPSARLIPLGLPASPYSTERGELVVEGREVVLRQKTDGPNRCLALLVSWRKQAPREWRALTVAEQSAACPPGTAFAARVGWGIKQTSLLVYRSLGPPALRSVLGHQTRARLVVGAFSPTGDVHPWVKAVEDHPEGG